MFVETDKRNLISEKVILVVLKILLL